MNSDLNLIKSIHINNQLIDYIKNISVLKEYFKGEEKEEQKQELAEHLSTCFLSYGMKN